MTNQNQAKLQKIVSLWRDLEIAYHEKTTLHPAGFPEGPLMNLKVLLTDLVFATDPQISRLAEVADHLHPQMDPRHFLNFLVPVERLLGKNISDGDILITTIDRKLQAREVRPLVFVLDNLRSGFNVGSIFRLADAVGAEHLFLCGYTPTPENESVKKTALGSEVVVPWSTCRDLPTALTTLKNRNYHVIALETAENSVDFYSGELKSPTAFVVGNERFGLDYPSLPLCDEVRTLPQVGMKNSVNVAVALGAAAFEWQRQWNLKKL